MRTKIIDSIEMTAMNDWIIIMTFNVTQDAYLAKAKLESEGIQTFLKDELTNQILNVYSITSGVKLQVMPQDYVRACEILGEAGYIVDSNGQDVPIETIKLKKTTDRNKCPFCQSEHILKISRPIVFDIVYTILGVISPLFKKNYKCQNCGKVWRYK
jgi:hypothetical protein